MDTLDAMISGQLIFQTKGKSVDDLPWTPNPKFDGVFMKHMVTSTDTNGSFSLHLVRVVAGHSIGNHIHEGQMELHTVIGGKGTAMLDQQKLDYHTGVYTVVPVDVPHEVHAEEDVYILATFVPALC